MAAVKVKLTCDVDGMASGETHALRGGYARALVSQGKAVYAKPGYFEPIYEVNEISEAEVVDDDVSVDDDGDDDVDGDNDESSYAEYT